MAADLRQRVAVDQALRAHLVQEMPASASEPSRLGEQLAIVDRANTRALGRWLARCGWPLRSAHGEATVGHAWLLAQHADQDPAFQRRALRLLERAVRRGEAPGAHLAYLDDRVALAAGRPQRYGTQFDLEPPCGLKMRPSDGEARVEARRRAVGLPPLAEYRALLLRHVMPPECAAVHDSPVAAPG